MTVGPQLRSRLTVLLACCATLFTHHSVAADDSLGAALSAWRSGETAKAAAILDRLAGPNQRDARVWLYYGLLKEQQGKDGTPQFEQSAKLEIVESSTYLVERDLEAVQGPIRAKIEAVRAAARVAARPETPELADQQDLRMAIQAWRTGEREVALASLGRMIARETTDPRAYYLRGAIQHQAGDQAAAEDDFRAGLSREDSIEKMERSSAILEWIQGDARLLLDTGITIGSEEAPMTRRDVHASIMRSEQARMQMQLTQSEEERAALAQQLEQMQRERDQAAAASIEAAEAADAELQKMLQDPVVAANDPPTAPVVADPTAEDPAEMQPVTPPPALPNSSFFGGSGSLAGGSTADTSSVPAATAPTTPEESIDFSYLPPTTEFIIRLRPAGLTGSGFMSDVMALPQVQQGLGQMQAVAGVVPADIESVTLGVANIIPTAMQIGMQVNAGGQNPDFQAILANLVNGGNIVAVVRTTKPINLSQLPQETGTANVDGQSVSLAYHSIAPPGSDVSAVVYPVDSGTYVVASKAKIETAVAGGSGEAERPAFAFASAANELGIAFASPVLAGMTAGIPQELPPAAPPSAVAALNAIRGKMSGAGIFLDAEQNLRFSLRVTVTDAAAAAALRDALLQLNEENQAQSQAMMGMLPPDLAPSLQAINDSVDVTVVDDTIVEFSEVIPKSLVTAFMQNPDLLGQLMMMGGQMGGPGAGPPGGFPPGGAPGAGPPGFAPPNQP